MADKKSGKIRKKRIYYAQVSNVALRDETISLKAKGLLALIESYLSLENFTLYKNFLISKSLDGESSFRGAWNELKEHGYLIQYKLKDNETKQFYYEYEICDNPQVENHHVAIDKAEAEKPQVENPHVGNLQVASPQVEEPYGSLATSSKLPPYNNDINNNNIINNNIYINIIRTNIDYEEVFVDSFDKELVDNIINIMDEVLSSNVEFVKINGVDIPSVKVKSILLKANMYHINYVIDVIKNYKEAISNIKGFVITTIYNSVLTLDLYYSNLINVDN